MTPPLRHNVSGGWIPADKNLRHHFPKDGRPYTVIEAYISHRIDLDEGATWTVNGYAKLWNWDRKRVRRFTSELGTPLGQFRNTVGTPLGHSIRNIFFGLEECQDMVGTPLGQGRDRVGDTTTNTKTKTLKTSSSFAIFWSAYPRTAGKAVAEKVWSRIKPNEQLVQEMLTALKWQSELENWQKDGGKFIPHPSTWLNGKRWEDEEPVVDKCSLETDSPSFKTDNTSVHSAVTAEESARIRKAFAKYE